MDLLTQRQLACLEMLPEDYPVVGASDGSPVVQCPDGQMLLVQPNGKLAPTIRIHSVQSDLQTEPG